MRKLAIVLSLVLHVGIAVALRNAAQSRALRRLTAVSLADEQKKKPKPAEHKPAPPKPRPVAAKVASISKVAPVAAPAPVVKAAVPAPVQTALQLSNDDDSPGGIAVPVAGAAHTADLKPAETEKVLGGEETHHRRAREDKPSGEQEGPCTEEPTKPEPVFKTDIEYVASARAEGIEGKLKLKLTVAADGSVSDVEVLSGVSPDLDAAAVAAAKLWRFKPALACGKAVDGGTYILARRFELGD